MALQECGLNLNSASKELNPHGSIEFPCAGYFQRYTERPEDSIPWHWHEELELIWMERGRMRVRAADRFFLLEEGDLAAVNSNILHSGAAVGECRLRSLVFSPALIAGNEDCVFAKKYIRPLLAARPFSGFLIRRENGGDVPLWFNHAFEALAGESCGYEFIVRENLSRICFFLYEKFKEEVNADPAPLNQDNLRIRRMMDYIHRNFAEDLSLPEIAAAADISERECLRCFKKTIQLSPIQYLLKYRVMRGAEMLLGQPSESISGTAISCGFDSPSNFAKVFRRFYNCTPREYRKKNTL